MKNPKPNWWLLCGTLLLAMVLLATVAFMDPSAGWRQFAECLILVTIYGAIALWVRANRVALALIDRAPGAAEPLRAWVAYCPPVAPRRRLGNGNESEQHLAA